MHVGTFTREGTWAAAIDKLPLVQDAGVSVIEMMPVAEFPGRFGWGYDGVALFAPTRLYGAPDDLRGFIDAAHRLGLGVILENGTRQELLGKQLQQTVGAKGRGEALDCASFQLGLSVAPPFGLGVPQ